MLDELTKKPQKVVIVGDNRILPEIMEDAMSSSRIQMGATVKLRWNWGADLDETLDPDEKAARQINLERNGPDVLPYAKGLDEEIADADILFVHFCPVPASLIKKAKHLKAILTCRGGVEHICINAASERNIPVINVIRNADAVADFAIGLIFAVTRNIASSHHALMQGEWKKTYPNSDCTTILSNLVVGLEGIGNIGIQVARRLKALGIRIVAHDDYVSKERLEKNGLGDVEMLASREDLFTQADVISLHLRLTDSTQKLIDKKYFSLMKPTAYFINTARGGLVNQEDLIEALRNHSIAGAALDVFDKEPLGADSALTKLDNVVMTSHIASAISDLSQTCPFMLTREVDKILTTGVTDRIVNHKAIQVG